MGESPADVVVINDALLPQWRMLPPRAVTRQLVDVVRAVDRTLEALDDDTIAAIYSAGLPIELYRSHRVEHLEEIERALVGS